jgi:hypothetical protein
MRDRLRYGKAGFSGCAGSVVQNNEKQLLGKGMGNQLPGIREREKKINTKVT